MPKIYWTTVAPTVTQHNSHVWSGGNSPIHQTCAFTHLWSATVSFLLLSPGNAKVKSYIKCLMPSHRSVDLWLATTYLIIVFKDSRCSFLLFKSLQRYILPTGWILLTFSSSATSRFKFTHWNISISTSYLLEFVSFRAAFRWIVLPSEPI